jgi:hypothetical protein
MAGKTLPLPPPPFRQPMPSTGGSPASPVFGTPNQTPDNDDDDVSMATRKHANTEELDRQDPIPTPPRPLMTCFALNLMVLVLTHDPVKALRNANLSVYDKVKQDDKTCIVYPYSVEDYVKNFEGKG